MKRFTLRLAALMAALLIGIQTTAAQDTPDLALLDAIATAFENTRAASRRWYDGWGRVRGIR